MSEYTPTPWTFQRAPKPTDGQYDCAVAAVIDGERHIIAETFGRAASNVFPDSEANAAFIVTACNSHDALVKALEECAIRCRYDGDLFHDQGNALRMRASWDAADLAEAALASIKETP